VLTKGGNRAASNDRVAAAAQRLGTIQPRPEVGTVTCSPDWVSLRVSNPGGPAVLWRVLVTVGDGVYYICTTAAAGCIGVMTSGGQRCKDLPTPLGAGESQLLASVATDVDGNLWDVRKRTVTTRSAVEILNDAGGPYDLTFE